MKKQSKENGKSTSKSTRVLEEALAAPEKDFKVRVTTYIDMDVYNELNRLAEKEGSRYQTLLNRYLRASVLTEVSESDIKAIKIALGA